MCALQTQLWVTVDDVKHTVGNSTANLTSIIDPTLPFCVSSHFGQNTSSDPVDQAQERYLPHEALRRQLK